MTCPNPHCRHKTKRKLRPLVISLIPDTDNLTDDAKSRTSRHEHITRMFTSHPSLVAHFEPPVFSPGVPSREIRNRLKLLQYSRRAGLIPDVEWQEIVRAVIEQTSAIPYYSLHDGVCESNIHSDNIVPARQNQHEVIDPFMYLAFTTEVEDSPETGQSPNEHGATKKRPQAVTKSLVPISAERKGSADDISIPYSMELWRKAKTLGRDRSVLACTLAHLIAMKKLVDSRISECEHDKFDFILEDNVRAFVGTDVEDAELQSAIEGGNTWSNHWTGWSCECSDRIWDIIELSGNIDVDEISASPNEIKTAMATEELTKCHLRYFGWLGSVPNLSWVYEKHIPRKGLGTYEMTIFPFPTNDDFELDSIPTDKESVKKSKKSQASARNESAGPHFTSPGGTAVFGTYAYSLSADAYHSLVTNLQNDVGALMWKSKKMKAYHAKAIDKILPRHVRSKFGEKSVHLPEKVVFVRSPMLGSLLHQQWEQGFCESTELQYVLSRGGASLSGGDTSAYTSSVWDHVWLTDEEREIVEYRRNSGKWIRKDDIPN
eukprot:CCRYP_002858-RA/>CCRYP_002858-RA protein AED:0.30 eAED:0.30 QI:0/-1/0/1/-1/1/1/0/545